MIKTSFGHIPVATWFPPGDKVATIMACLCALREDLYIEFTGLHIEAFPKLDECSVDYRRTYFFRNQFRTLFEIMGAFRMITKHHKPFMAEVYKLHPQIESEFTRIVSLLDEAYDQVKGFRDDIGGHLQHQAVRDGLPKIPTDTKGLFQEGVSPNTIHYKFALEILGATMLRHVPLSAAKEEWDNLFTKMISIGIEALNFIDALFHCYERVRALPRG